MLLSRLHGTVAELERTIATLSTEISILNRHLLQDAQPFGGDGAWSSPRSSQDLDWGMENVSINSHDNFHGNRNQNPPWLKDGTQSLSLSQDRTMLQTPTANSIKLHDKDGGLAIEDERWPGYFEQARVSTDGAWASLPRRNTHPSIAMSEGLFEAGLRNSLGSADKLPAHWACFRTFRAVDTIGALPKPHGSPT